MAEPAEPNIPPDFAAPKRKRGRDTGDKPAKYELAFTWTFLVSIWNAYFQRSRKEGSRTIDITKNEGIPEGKYVIPAKVSYWISVVRSGLRYDTSVEVQEEFASGASDKKVREYSLLKGMFDRLPDSWKFNRDGKKARDEGVPAPLPNQTWNTLQKTRAAQYAIQQEGKILDLTRERDKHKENARIHKQQAEEEKQKATDLKSRLDRVEADMQRQTRVEAEAEATRRELEELTDQFNEQQSIIFRLKRRAAGLVSALKRQQKSAEQIKQDMVESRTDYLQVVADPHTMALRSSQADDSASATPLPQALPFSELLQVERPQMMWMTSGIRGPKGAFGKSSILPAAVICIIGMLSYNFSYANISVAFQMSFIGLGLTSSLCVKSLPSSLQIPSRSAIQRILASMRTLLICFVGSQLIDERIKNYTIHVDGTSKFGLSYLAICFTLDNGKKLAFPPVLVGLKDVASQMVVVKSALRELATCSLVTQGVLKPTEDQVTNRYYELLRKCDRGVTDHAFDAMGFMRQFGKLVAAAHGPNVAVDEVFQVLGCIHHKVDNLGKKLEDLRGSFWQLVKGVAVKMGAREKYALPMLYVTFKWCTGPWSGTFNDRCYEGAFDLSLLIVWHMVGGYEHMIKIHLFRTYCRGLHLDLSSTFQRTKSARFLNSFYNLTRIVLSRTALISFYQALGSQKTEMTQDKIILNMLTDPYTQIELACLVLVICQTVGPGLFVTEKDEESGLSKLDHEQARAKLKSVSDGLKAIDKIDSPTLQLIRKGEYCPYGQFWEEPALKAALKLLNEQEKELANTLEKKKEKDAVPQLVMTYLLLITHRIQYQYEHFLDLDKPNDLLPKRPNVPASNDLPESLFACLTNIFAVGRMMLHPFRAGAVAAAMLMRADFMAWLLLNIPLMLMLIKYHNSAEQKVMYEVIDEAMQAKLNKEREARLDEGTRSKWQELTKRIRAEPKFKAWDTKKNKRVGEGWSVMAPGHLMQFFDLHDRLAFNNGISFGQGGIKVADIKNWVKRRKDFHTAALRRKANEQFEEFDSTDKDVIHRVKNLAYGELMEKAEKLLEAIDSTEAPPRPRRQAKGKGKKKVESESETSETSDSEPSIAGNGTESENEWLEHLEALGDDDDEENVQGILGFENAQFMDPRHQIDPWSDEENAEEQQDFDFGSEFEADDESEDSQVKEKEKRGARKKQGAGSKAGGGRKGQIRRRKSGRKKN